MSGSGNIQQIESLPWEPDPLTAEEEAEFERRWQEQLTHPETGLTLEQVIAYVTRPR